MRVCRPYLEPRLSSPLLPDTLPSLTWVDPPHSVFLVSLFSLLTDTSPLSLQQPLHVSLHETKSPCKGYLDDVTIRISLHFLLCVWGFVWCMCICGRGGGGRRKHTGQKKAYDVLFYHTPLREGHALSLNLELSCGPESHMILLSLDLTGSYSAVPDFPHGCWVLYLRSFCLNSRHS